MTCTKAMREASSMQTWTYYQPIQRRRLTTPVCRPVMRCRMDERRKAIFVAFHDLIPGTTYVRPGEEWSAELRRAFDRTMEEIEVIIDERRVSPRPDFISDLVNARDAGDKLNDRELFDQIFGICGASLSATTRAAGGALHLIYTHDDQRHQLIRDPSLIPDAIEECLRLGSNGYFTFPRIATRDI